LTYTDRQRKVVVNRVSLTPFSAPLESSRSSEVNSPPIEEHQVVNLCINERRAGNVTILDLKGRVRMDGGAVELHKAIRCLLDEGKSQILLNLSGVTHIDSTGLGELISIHISVGNKGGEIKLTHLTERLRDLMTITKLLTVFDVHDNESEALASFTVAGLEVVEAQPLFM
jgi:anti-sigma B factor antagonist